MAASVASRTGGLSNQKSGRCGRVVKMGEKAPPTVYKRYICSFPGCSSAYNKNWKLQAHLCKHTGEKPFPCTVDGCNKGFVTLFHLTRHTLTHSGERPCKCENQDYCTKTFKKHNQLKVHQYSHTNQQPFKCNHEGCDKNFVSASKLKRHEKVHAGYPCDKDGACPFVGKTWTEYLKHVSASHSEPVICDVCNWKFKNKQLLKDHKRTHEQERLVYRCPREGCDRTYTKKFGLQSHILSFHEESRPFSCTHPGCGKMFAMKQSLARHANTHDPEKKKMKKKRPKRSLASRLSGYKPKKSPKTSSPQSSLGKPPPDPTTAMLNLKIK